jgi:DNA-binding transcriptional LysR family regulator
MEIYQARYFLAVSEERSFTRAAKRCGVSQPSLSIGIKRLETELGGLLFHRRGGIVSLSPLGLAVKPHVEKFHGHANDLCRQLDRLKQVVQAQHQEHTANGEPHAFRAQTAAPSGDRRHGDPRGGLFHQVDALIEEPGGEPIGASDR